MCGATNALNNAITRNTRICNHCMRQKTLVLQYGSRVRFCYGHRQLESVDKFKLDRSRRGVREISLLCCTLLVLVTFPKSARGGGG